MAEDRGFDTDAVRVTRGHAGRSVTLLVTPETAVVEEVYGHRGAITAPGFADLADGTVRASNI